MDMILRHNARYCDLNVYIRYDSIHNLALFEAGLPLFRQLIRFKACRPDSKF